ncbi:CRISPR-associated endoribonuclease Cas6 [Lyngbya confervoides]|uniref:CRISPR-associated endoribonuclease Cas6 n=1 Tax=Lyngbya confervoides BDU141951 TaxID=1574623 RepID=A0ABD4T517_9CYAN|nr:CRISPR-associated endoribonuclease Cas6 [Lyngbya confervoides]MCM1983754.1 CRISPR-associated endoribonuclease Cas6 [Lyngbya confervoides BDU141951]
MIPQAPQILATQKSALKWPPNSQLVGLRLTLQPNQADSLSVQYAVGLHAWLLNQVKQDDPALATKMHDNQTEKSFSISRFHSLTFDRTQSLTISPSHTYEWQINGFSSPFVQWLSHWVKRQPKRLHLYQQTWQIKAIAIALTATTYSTLWSRRQTQSISLSFLSPTSFRRHGHHIPLPNPPHLLASYLRRWNQFAPRTFDPAPFLDWVDQHVMISRHELKTTRTTAGKQGLFTGFLGNIELVLDASAQQKPDFVRLFYALCRLAPYCGTGHKTTHGLGYTRLGWSKAWMDHLPAVAETALAERIQSLSDFFLSQKKRQGGDRGRKSAELWATVYARHERGESLVAIAQELEIPYQSVKTYSKLANRALQSGGASYPHD